MENDIHFATFHDYGFPPEPAPPKHEQRLAGTYFRGNDERSPLLFNGGNYRTATFNISVVDGHGNRLEYGDAVVGKALCVRLEIVRPEFTPDFLYSDRFMQAMFLTTEASKSLGRDQPVADRVPLTAIKEMWLWHADYSVTESAQAEAEHQGVVYVCQDQLYQPHRFAGKDTVGGARFHYGMDFHLVVRDGKLAEASGLSLGSLYRTRKFPLHEVPFDQWFSENPIPELPTKNTEDPSLLGIDDYLE